MFIKPKGTRDYFGKEMISFSLVREVLYKVAKNFDYSEIIFPTFEQENLFTKAVGQDSDVVSKEMFRFKDLSDRGIVLRPEGTASTMRLCLENKLFAQNKKHKFFYFQPMFRYERPQKGRQREFFQFGIENFGNDNIDAEIETVLMAKRILDSFEISKYELRINSIGSIATRKKYIVELKKFLNKNKSKLSNESKDRIEANPLRILDSKDEKDIKILEKSPSILDFLNPEESKRYKEIKKTFDKVKIKYIETSSLVRGLDYYNDFVFEFISTDIENLGSKATIIGGGRYDNLTSMMTDNKISNSAIGFALGVERLILAATKYFTKKIATDEKIMIIPFDKEFVNEALILFEKLVANNIVVINNDDTKFTKKLENASKNNFSKVIIVDKLISKKEVILKDLDKKSQKIVKIIDIKDKL